MDKDLSKNFGILIAYVIPGFLGLCAVAVVDNNAATWLGTAAGRETTVGAFLFAMLASVGLGLLLNAIRWQVLEQWAFRRFANLPKEVDYRPAGRTAHPQEAEDLREQHYRFFQFFGNTAVALAIAAVLLAPVVTAAGWSVVNRVGALAAFILVEALLLNSARSCLTKYRDRLRELEGPRAQGGDEVKPLVDLPKEKRDSGDHPRRDPQPRPPEREPPPPPPPRRDE